MDNGTTDDGGFDIAGHHFNLTFPYGNYLETAIAVFCLAVGLVLTFYGTKFFKLLLIVFSFMLGCAAGFFIFMVIKDDSGAALACGVAVGILFMLLVLKVYKLSLFLIGAALGLTLWLVFKALFPGVLTDKSALYAILVLAVLICGALSLHYEKVWLLFATPFIGAFLICQAVVSFTNQKLNTFQILDDPSQGCSDTVCYLSYGLLFGVAGLGFLVQYFFTSKFAKARKAKQDAKLAEKYKRGEVKGGLPALIRKQPQDPNKQWGGLAAEEAELMAQMKKQKAILAAKQEILEMKEKNLALDQKRAESDLARREEKLEKKEEKLDLWEAKLGKKEDGLKSKEKDLSKQEKQHQLITFELEKDRLKLARQKEDIQLTVIPPPTPSGRESPLPPESPPQTPSFASAAVLAAANNNQLPPTPSVGDHLDNVIICVNCNRKQPVAADRASVLDQVQYCVFCGSNPRIKSPPVTPVPLSQPTPAPAPAPGPIIIYIRDDEPGVARTKPPPPSYPPPVTAERIEGAPPVGVVAAAGAAGAAAVVIVSSTPSSSATPALSPPSPPVAASSASSVSSVSSHQPAKSLGEAMKRQLPTLPPVVVSPQSLSQPAAAGQAAQPLTPVTPTTPTPNATPLPPSHQKTLTSSTAPALPPHKPRPTMPSQMPSASPTRATLQIASHSPSPSASAAPIAMGSSPSASASPVAPVVYPPNFPSWAMVDVKPVYHSPDPLPSSAPVVVTSSVSPGITHQPSPSFYGTLPKPQAPAVGDDVKRVVDQTADKVWLKVQERLKRIHGDGSVSPGPSPPASPTASPQMAPSSFSSSSSSPAPVLPRFTLRTPLLDVHSERSSSPAAELLEEGMPLSPVAVPASNNSASSSSSSSSSSSKLLGDQNNESEGDNELTEEMRRELESLVVQVPTGEK